MTKRLKPPAGKGLFGDPAAADVKPAAASAAYRANIDGGSRGNPGPASYGVVIRDARGGIAAKLKKYIGRTTNNVAEYFGLIAALDYAESHGIHALRIESDSELLVKQMRGQYKVKSGDLRPLYERAKKMSQALDFFRIDHVYREQNEEADALANQAMDETAGVLKSATTTMKAATTAKSLAARTTSSAAEKPASRCFRARYRGGVLYLLEDVDLPDGDVVEVEIRAIPKKP
jgi:ribonuclease HI